MIVQGRRQPPRDLSGEWCEWAEDIEKERDGGKGGRGERLVKDGGKVEGAEVFDKWLLKRCLSVRRSEKEHKHLFPNQ